LSSAPVEGAAAQTRVSPSPCRHEQTGRARPDWELADVFRLYGEIYRRIHWVPSLHQEVIDTIQACRTSVLGGHLERCDACAFERIAYNSCGNRHCPKCQSMAKAAWLEARQAELLPVGYFHNVFTLPHEINPIALANKKLIFDLLFNDVAETLHEFARDPKHGLGGKIGFTALLHTWDQLIRPHIHLHCVIPGGALSPDGKRWIPSRDNYLFPVKALSRLFRGKFLDHLRKAFTSGKLRFPGKAASLGTQEGFSRLIRQLRGKEWTAYSKKPFASPEKVLDYLGRYTHRVAISNYRITNVADGLVTFRYRDRKDDDKLKECTLPAPKFIHRFLQHLLPKAYVRIRHYGFLANRAKGTDLARCRQLLGLSAELPRPQKKTTQELLLKLTGEDLTKCPRCKKGTMHVFQEFPRPTRALARANRGPP